MTQNTTEKPKIVKVKDENKWLVLSSNKEEYYHVTLESCDCKAFQYRKRCRHLDEVYDKVQKEAEAEFNP